MMNEERKSLRLVRTFNAPIELMWEAWTKPEHIAQWYGPSGFTNTIHSMDFSEGGEWTFTMHGPDGTNYENRNIFREIIYLKKIVYEHTYPHFFATIIFESEGDKTTIDWTVELDSAEMLEMVIRLNNAEEGHKQNMEKLEKYLLSM